MDKKFDQDFDDILNDPALETEPEAPVSDKLDAELEEILAEDWDSVPTQPEAPRSAEDALNEFLYSEEENPAPEAEEDLSQPTRMIPLVEEELAVPQEEVLPGELEEEYEEEESCEEEPPRPKGRPKRKKGYGLLGIPHIVSTLIWLAITAMIGVSLGRVLWVCCADVMAFGRPEVTAYITVTEEDDITDVAQKLADAHLIRYPGLFQKFAEITKKDDRIRSGVHELSSHLDYNAMINNMVYVNKVKEEIEITFPEGYNCAQIFRLLEEKEVCPVEELEKWAAEGELDDYWFLEDLPRGSKYCLEGYLAPDTYRFYTNDNPRNVLEKFLDAFDARFTDLMREDLEIMQGRYAKLLEKGGFSSDYIAAHPLTLHQVLTLASVVERETASEEEGYVIASVFYNRLTDQSIQTMGSDATVYYALGDYFREKGKLTQEDLNSDSPYNTRKATGFPPGPICNPGAYSLYAALDPDDNDYRYFIYDETVSKHLFSVTYEEHLQKAKELGK